MIIEVIVLLLLSHLILGIILWLQVKDLYNYPNALGLPIIGNVYYFYKGYCFYGIGSGNRYLNSLIQKTGQDNFFTFLLGKRALILSCPKTIEKIVYHPHMADKAACVYGPLNSIIKGIFSYCQSDQEWKTRRKEMNNKLTKNLIEGAYHDVFVSLGRELVEDIEASHLKKSNFLHPISDLTIKAVLGTLCGIEQKMAINRFSSPRLHFLIDCTSYVMINPIIALIYRFAIRVYDKFFATKMNFHRQKIFGDIFKKLREIEKEATLDSKSLPLSAVISSRNRKRNQQRSELKKELYELIAAGSHTVSTILVNTLHCLATIPQLQEKVWEEQFEIFGKDPRDPTIEDLKKMLYLERCIKEVLRFFSTPFFGKWTTGEVNIEGLRIPEGTLVTIPSYRIRMDPRYWKDPQVFDPDRFLDEDSRPKYSYTPFGVGVRSCPGFEYGKNELKIILSTVLRRFKLSSPQEFKDLKFKMSIINEISNMTKLHIEERT